MATSPEKEPVQADPDPPIPKRNAEHWSRKSARSHRSRTQTAPGCSRKSRPRHDGKRRRKRSRIEARLNKRRLHGRHLSETATANHKEVISRTPESGRRMHRQNGIHSRYIPAAIKATTTINGTREPPAPAPPETRLDKAEGAAAWESGATAGSF